MILCKINIIFFLFTLSLVVSAADMPFFQGYILPSPQAIKYGNKDIDLSKFSISGKKESAHARYLIQRLEKRGGKLTVASSIKISLGIGSVSGVSAPDKPEAYTVRIKEHEIVIAGHDKLGLLWGISSLIQMTHRNNGKLLLREFNGSDWPRYRFRGVNTSGPLLQKLLDLAICFKANFAMGYGILQICDLPFPGGWKAKEGAWLTHEPPRQWLDRVSKLRTYTELGLTWGAGPMFLGGRSFALSDTAAYEKLMKWLKPIAAAGGKVLITFDDTRFPVKPKDLKKFGSAAKADVWFLNKINTDVKKISASSGVIFVPPFYWGPDFDPSARYGVNRDEYLKTLSTLPKDIEIAYAGKAVFGGKLKKSEVAWFSSLIDRKPFYWPNGRDNDHMHGYHFGTDPVKVVLGHYDGAFNDVHASFPIFGADWETSYAGAVFSYFWNPAAYDCEQTILQVLGMLIGKKNIKFIASMNKIISTTDPYNLTVTPGSVRNIKVIQKAAKQLNLLCDEIKKADADKVLAEWSGIYHWQKRLNRFAAQLEAAYKSGKYKNFDNSEFDKAAAQECNWKNGDILLTAYSFNGGTPPGKYTFRQPDVRSCTAVRGKGANNQKMSASFRMPTISQKYRIFISGQDDDMPGPSKVLIKINDRKVFKGKNPCEPFKWKMWNLDIPKGALKEGNNTFSIENISDGGTTNSGRFFLVNYVVIKPVEAK